MNKQNSLITRYCLAVVVMLALLGPLATAPVLGVTEFKDGQTHNIDWGIPGDVWVDFQAPAMQTTINLLDNGGIGGNFYSYGCSQVNMSGGSIGHYLCSYDSTQVNISGGNILDSLSVSDSTQVNMSGGWIGENLFAYDSTQINISGGWISRWLIAHDSTQVDISSGSIWNLHASESTQVNISGGWIGEDLSVYGSSQVDISGGTVGGDFFLDQDSLLTIKGHDFAVDGSPVGYGDITSILRGSYSDEPRRYLTGTLLSGQAIRNDFYIGDNAKITLVPEPTHILTIDVDPNDVGIDTITPSVGAHDYAGRVNINAQQFAKCPDVYVFDHWEGDVNDPNSANTTVFMDTDKTVTAVFVDGRKCGDECHPYPAGDIDKNCIVDFNDFGLFALSWLECTKPECD